MTAHDELRTLYALRREALARHSADGAGAPAGLGSVAQLIEERERRLLDGPVTGEAARLAGIVHVESPLAA